MFVSHLRLQKIGNHYYTLNLIPGKKVYGERLTKDAIGEWREWNPFRSKLCAGLHNGLSLEHFAIREGSKVLYLGSAEGTTVSHVSDVIGEDGLVVGVDVSPHVMSKFSALVESRENILPLLGDANQPETYASELEGMKFDVLVQDVAQKNQAEIFSKNWDLFAHPKSVGYLVIKSKSVDFTKPKEQVLKQELKMLGKHIKVEQILSLEKHEKSHFLLCVKWQ